MDVRKVSAHLFATLETNGNWEALLYTRLTQPFYGKQGFPSGKVKFGEMIEDAARRELKEETNLNGEPTLFGITHYLVKSNQTHEVLDDKIFLTFSSRTLLEN